jgi:hypothetical protein
LANLEIALPRFPAVAIGKRRTVIGRSLEFQEQRIRLTFNNEVVQRSKSLAAELPMEGRLAWLVTWQTYCMEMQHQPAIPMSTTERAFSRIWQDVHNNCCIAELAHLASHD